MSFEDTLLPSHECVPHNIINLHSDIFYISSQALISFSSKGWGYKIVLTYNDIGNFHIAYILGCQPIQLEMKFLYHFSVCKDERIEIRLKAWYVTCCYFGCVVAFIECNCGNNGIFTSS